MDVERIGKKKAYICQPVKGKSPIEISKAREKGIHFLEGKGYEVICTYFSKEWLEKLYEGGCGYLNEPLAFLAKSLGDMAKCDAVYFAEDWQDSQACRLEHAAAEGCGLYIFD